jgi:DNA (cytosine-5)-methyltransferase 1
VTCERVSWPWKIADSHMPKNVGKVMSTFACGGGSSLGYKLAGFDVIAMNEIDPAVAEVYLRNNKPDHSFICSIKDLITADLPEELFDLDILDGSPPCTPFKTDGNRDAMWGVKKKFMEGQASQRLDDLFFDFIALGERLQPRVIIAENVTGLLQGKARGYVKEIFQGLKRAGYDVQAFTLDSSRMGVAQKRRRAFFVARRRDLNLPPLKLQFEEKIQTFADVLEMIGEDPEPDMDTRIPLHIERKWKQAKPGQPLSAMRKDGQMGPGRHLASRKRQSMNHPPFTLVAQHVMIHPTKPRYLTEAEWMAISSWPTDYDFGTSGIVKRRFFLGMSVPPLMMQRLALEIAEQWGAAFSEGPSV